MEMVYHSYHLDLVVVLVVAADFTVSNHPQRLFSLVHYTTDALLSGLSPKKNTVNLSKRSLLAPW
jgi:hypothetical protein